MANYNKSFLIALVVLLHLEKLQGHVPRKHHSLNEGVHLHHEPELLVDVIRHNTRNDFTPAPPKLKPYRDTCTSDDAICVLPVQCPAHFKNKENKYCNVIGGRRGICCITGQNHTRK